MSQPEPTPPPQRAPAPKVQVPAHVAEILAPSLQVGLGAGTVGLFVGAASGIIRSAAPVLFSLVTGAQWFALSSSYYAARMTVLQEMGRQKTITSSDKIKASALAGATAGAVGGALRGPRNILPAIAVFSLVGAGGQVIFNRMPSEAAAEPDTAKSWLDSKWSPVKPLTDDEYTEFIDEKILKIDVEISLVDDKLAELRAAKAAREAGRSPKDDL
ncbi:hypothetical protein F503_06073 [Ophiostoma piceae UAMH 11346]|uniref:Beta-ketoacyl synthase n=1 Tax=Ophiostoma piceae (strain UAMH 11346) TaxID=1262450 RepID=S3CW74_OPHP1|nr:hypothetical protein F503_06073 [Ophiostoma piceae UAMH 11346]